MTHYLTKLKDAEQLELKNMLLRLAIFLNEHKDKIDSVTVDNCMYGDVFTMDDKAMTIDFNRLIIDS